MVKVTEEEKRILLEKIEARKQRECYQENEMQLPDAYDIPEGKGFGSGLEEIFLDS